MPGPAPELVARVGALGTTGFAGEAFRHVSPGRDPLSVVGSRIHGGRWNPPERFGALYLGLDVATVADELHRLAAAQGLAPEELVPRELHRLRVRLVAVLDLRPPEATAALGLRPRELSARARRACQTVGDAAHELGLEGLLAPSAAGPGIVLAAFPDRLLAGSSLEPLDVEVWSEPPPHRSRSHKENL